MKNKKLLVIVIVVVLVLPTLFGLWLVQKNLHSAQKGPNLPLLKAISKQAEPTKTAPDTSDHLIIEKIGVDAKIITVGLTKEGNMEAPANIYDVGWYKYGAKIGQSGTAVLAGHLDGAGGEKGVFHNLDQLKAGGLITINYYNGPTYTYKVTKTQTYNSTDRPSEVFKSSSGAHLNLITCTGSWDKNKAEYDKRLVVFTNLVK